MFNYLPDIGSLLGSEWQKYFPCTVGQPEKVKNLCVIKKGKNKIYHNFCTALI